MCIHLTCAAMLCSACGCGCPTLADFISALCASQRCNRWSFSVSVCDNDFAGDERCVGALLNVWAYVFWHMYIYVYRCICKLSYIYRRRFTNVLTSGGKWADFMNFKKLFNKAVKRILLKYFRLLEWLISKVISKFSISRNQKKIFFFFQNNKKITTKFIKVLDLKNKIQNFRY